eukprot:14801900-Heterocapsa_arctica.AAC.1
MTKKVGGVRMDSLTTRELMGYRVFWHEGVGCTIPPWAHHLNAGVCTLCMCRDYCGLYGIDKTCTYCKGSGLIYAWETLTIYDKEKDDMARGLIVRDANFY